MPTEPGTRAGNYATTHVLSVLSVIALLGGLLAACSTDSPAATPAQQAGTTTPAVAATQTVPATPAGSPTLPQGSQPVQLDPAKFSVDISNPYWPMQVGDRWVYQETDGDGGTQQVEVTVLDQTRTVAAGIEARVVHDVVTTDGQVIEDTYDWYAQDSAGNIWYLGEDTKEFENGDVVSTEGSWEAGVDNAQPGIAVPADPAPGMQYRQEYLAGEAEDNAVVLATREQVQVPAGNYAGTLLTRDTTPLQPEISELKFYAPGIGPVLVVQVSGGTSREELVETTRTPR